MVRVKSTSFKFYEEVLNWLNPARYGNWVDQNNVAHDPSPVHICLSELLEFNPRAEMDPINSHKKGLKSAEGSCCELCCLRALKADPKSVSVALIGHSLEVVSNSRCLASANCLNMFT